MDLYDFISIEQFNFPTLKVKNPFMLDYDYNCNTIEEIASINRRCNIYFPAIYQNRDNTLNNEYCIVPVSIDDKNMKVNDKIFTSKRLLTQVLRTVSEQSFMVLVFNTDQNGRVYSPNKTAVLQTLHQAKQLYSSNSFHLCTVLDEHIYKKSELLSFLGEAFYKYHCFSSSHEACMNSGFEMYREINNYSQNYNKQLSHINLDYCNSSAPDIRVVQNLLGYTDEGLAHFFDMALSYFREDCCDVNIINNWIKYYIDEYLFHIKSYHDKIVITRMHPYGYYIYKENKDLIQKYKAGLVIVKEDETKYE